MNGAVTGLIVISMFMLVTVLIIQVLDIAWNTQVDAHQDFTYRQSTIVDVGLTTDTTTDCLTYTATVANNREAVVTDFTGMDLLV